MPVFKTIIDGGQGRKIKLLKFNDKLDIGIVLINPKIQLSTKQVFNNFSIKKPREKRPIISVSKTIDIYKISSLGNDLEKTAIKIVPEISNILNFLKNMTHALVMVCLVLELPAMEYSIQERKQMILKNNY